MLKKIKLTSLALMAAGLLCASVFAAPSKPTTLKADVIVYDSATGISTAEGNVVIIQEDGEAHGERGEYNLNTKVGWLEGNVTGTKGDASLAAHKVWVKDQNHITAEGSARVTKAGDSVYAPRIDYWSDREYAKTSGGWAKLEQADGSSMTADYMEYDMKKGEGFAEKNVKLDSPARNMTGAGDHATYTADRPDKQGEFVLTGNAWVIQDGNKIIGNRLVVKSDQSTSEANGNVRLDIQPKDTEPEQVTEEPEVVEEEEESVLWKSRRTSNKQSTDE